MLKLADILNEVKDKTQVLRLAKEFMSSDSYNSDHDCKKSTYEFVNWLKKNKGFEPDVLLLAPPSAEVVKKNPELKGKSGDGDSHIFAIVDGYGVDFTANQFPGISDSLKITPENKIPGEYKKIGGYFTDYPDWFENGKTSLKTKWANLPTWMLKDLKEGIDDPVKPGILKKRLGKLSCSRVRSAKSKLKNKGTHYAKALQRYLNYHC